MAAMGQLPTVPECGYDDAFAPKAVVSALLDWSPRGEAKRQINR
jgi:hypothetical protein